MMSNKPRFLLTQKNRSIAYVKHYHKFANSSLGILFLGGFRSNMDGTKASYLEQWCVERKYNFLKFDYSGHGESSGSFESGCISEWSDDACEVLDKLTDGPQILVGSSMGGWISLIVGKKRSQRMAAFIGIAAAPDFTENSMWANLNEKDRRQLETLGKINLENDYSSESYIVTKKLITDGRANLILSRDLYAPYSIRLLQGMLDNDVHFSTAIKLAQHINHNDVRVTLIKNGDHQLSSPDCLKMLKETILEFL